MAQVIAVLPDETVWAVVSCVRLRGGAHSYHTVSKAPTGQQFRQVLWVLGENLRINIGFVQVDIVQHLQLRTGERLYTKKQPTQADVGQYTPAASTRACAHSS
jgi:hypothetical protein